MSSAEQERLHATAVAVKGCAALLIGPSGSGKSSLALQLLSLGAKLVADDQCLLSSENDALMVARPDTLPELIEARGFGLLKVPMATAASVRLVVDLAEVTDARIPEDEAMSFLGHQVKMIKKSQSAHFPAAVLLYLQSISAT